MRLSRFCFALALILAMVAAPVPTSAQTANGKGKISRNMYRTPYADNVSVTMAQDYKDHGNTPAGDTGSMDMNGPAGTAIVAAAAGTVIAVNDTLSGCGCNAAYGTCANSVQIQHPNGEVSTYLHIAQNSATNLGIAINTVVAQGQQIGVEGDVGWTCGSGSLPRTSPGCTPPVNTVPSGTGRCGPHLHWNVVRATTGERVNPMTCGITNNLYVDNGVTTSAPCSATGCPFDPTVSDLTLDLFAEWRVFQSENRIVADRVEVNNFGSLVLHAGRSVRMTPGFHVDAGGYARAEIGLCNTTAATRPTTAAADADESPTIDLSIETEGY